MSPVLNANFALILSSALCLASGPSGCAPSAPDSTTNYVEALPSASTSANTPLDSARLRDAAAAAGRLIGVALAKGPLTADARYRELAAAEFDYVTPENATKWDALAPSASSYDWAPADEIVEFATSNQMAVKGHTFLWHRQIPAWLSTALSAEELTAAIKNHIQTTLTHYQGKVRAWDVVNEAVDTSSASGYTESLYWQKLGPEYIANAFRWAREADPDVLLFYNEVGIERLGAKSDFTYAMLRDLLAQGVPIDGIGFQSHVSAQRYPAASDLRANLRRFADLGLRVNLSEVDARTNSIAGDEQLRWGAERLAFQGIVGACALEPACEAITFWGFTDAYSWINDEGQDDPLLFTRDYQKKPAYQGVLDGLRGLLPVHGQNLLRNADFAQGGEQWAADGGQLGVELAVDRAGSAACVDARADGAAGLVQRDLLEALAAGGPLAFSAWVRTDANATVDASLLIEEGGQPREFNIASRAIEGGIWTEFSGYLGLGFSGTAESVALKIHGPAANVQLCTGSVALQALSSE